MNLSVKIGKLKLKKPVMAASGTFGYAQEFDDFIDLKKLGAIVTKTITLLPRQGNPPPRTFETPAGMLNSIGLENPGLDKFIENKLPELRKIGLPLIVSIASSDDPQEFIELTKKLDKISAVSAIELNISCPNLHKTKLISQDSNLTFKLVESVRKYTAKTIITKLSPNVTSIVEIAQAAQEAGSDAVALINTLYGLSVDINKMKPKLGVVTGGLSGPAIRPVALKMVWETYKKIKIPIIGMGGIIDTSSALEFILCGASALSIGTANFINPRITIEIISGLKKYLSHNKISDINKIIGGLKA